MNPTAVPPSAPPRPRAERRWWWLVLGVILVPSLLLGGLVVGVASFFRPSADCRAVRDGVIQASGSEWRQRVSLNVGSVTLGAVRAGLSFVPMEPEARAAARAVRGFEIGVFERASGAKEPDGATMLAIASENLAGRGWERVVAVLDGEETVGVFLRATTRSESGLRACVVVFDGRHMVVASVRAELDPLLECLRSQGNRLAEARQLACR